MNLGQTGVVSSSDAQKDLSWFKAHSGVSCPSTRDVSTYDGNGKLLKQEQLVDGTSTWQVQSSTIYIGGVYELHQDGSTTKYYGAMGQTIAVRQTPAGGGQGTVLYPLHDHLGSTVAMLDQSGNVAGTASYWPYGALRNATGALAGSTPPATDKLYTGQQQARADPALGLYNYNARFYSTTLGAFVSADTVGCATAKRLSGHIVSTARPTLRLDSFRYAQIRSIARSRLPHDGRARYHPCISTTINLPTRRPG